MSLGTGLAGAVWTARLRGLVNSPVRVQAQGGTPDVRWDGSAILIWPAEVAGRGEYYLR
jgi:diaminopimelate epimerase